MMFWFFPATTVHWRDVWPAGLLTACLIWASRYLIGIYLKFITTSVVYGAMASLAVILIWVYMTGLVVFFGAAFSHAWALTFGSRCDQNIEPNDPDLDISTIQSELSPELLSPKRR